MFLVCRHIKSNGVRCQSPAMRGHAFCYYHARAHAVSRVGVMDNLYLPVAENPAAIQLAISHTVQAMLASRISTKQAGLILYSLGVAASILKRKVEPLTDPVRSASQSAEGVDLAPELCIDQEGNQHTDCVTCPHHDRCDRMLERETESGEAGNDAKSSSNYRTGRVRPVPADLLPKNEADLVKRFGSDPLIKKYFEPVLAGVPEPSPKADGRQQEASGSRKIVPSASFIHNIDLFSRL